MSTFHKNYFALEGGLSYKTFLKHFKDQANGTRTAVLMSNRGKNGSAKSGFGGPSVRGSLVLVDLADREENVNNDGEKMPRIEVVDPTEAERRRALDRVALESSDKKVAKQESERKGNVIKKRNHSATGTGKSQNKKRKSASNTVTRKIVKRARDIFDS